MLDTARQAPAWIITLQLVASAAMGCGDAPPTDPSALEHCLAISARQHCVPAGGKADGVDYCAELGWYDDPDGYCDDAGEYCGSPDPDCGSAPNRCGDTPSSAGLAWSGDPAVGCQDVALACAEGVVLPEERIDGYVLNPPVPPQPVRMRSRGVLEERAPTEFDYQQMVAYHPDRGIERQGWSLGASQGERFAHRVTTVAAFPAGRPMVIRIYGPIAQCQAPFSAEIRGEGQWVAPKDGTYLAVPTVHLYKKLDGTIVEFPNSSIYRHGWFELRRLQPNGKPAQHWLLPEADWSGRHVAQGVHQIWDAALSDLDEDGQLDIVAHGEIYTGDGPERATQLMVFRRRHDGNWERRQVSPSCEPWAVGLVRAYDGGLLVADLTGDGRRDVLVQRPEGVHYELHEAQADGSFACHSPVLDGHRAGQTHGAVDLDGDLDLDLVESKVQFVGGGKSQLYLMVHLNDGTGHFVTQPRIVHEVPVHASQTRGVLRDVDGDGQQELLVAAGRAGGSPWYGAFALPSLALLDLPATPLAEQDLDRRGVRRWDMDGDGIVDVLQARRWGWEELALALSYGRPDGHFEPPWPLRAPHQLGCDHPIVDVADVDGDDCPDVLAGGAGLTLFSGWRCAAAR